MGAILAGSVAALATYALARRQERESDWRRLRLENYQEFLLALSGIIEGRSTDDAQSRFADAVNTMALVAPISVYRKVQAFHEYNAVSNRDREAERQQQLLNDVIRAMRGDVHPSLRDKDDAAFYMIGVPNNSLSGQMQYRLLPIECHIELEKW